MQPEAQDRRRQPRAVPLIHQERLLLHHKESHRRQAKRPSKLRAVPPKNPALQPELLQEMLRLPLLPPLQFLY